MCVFRHVDGKFPVARDTLSHLRLSSAAQGNAVNLGGVFLEHFKLVENELAVLHLDIYKYLK